MRSDPRCPSCDGKVSATATWCMHCGRDFDAPVDRAAEGAGGTVTRTREDGVETTSGGTAAVTAGAESDAVAADPTDRRVESTGGSAGEGGGVAYTPGESDLAGASGLGILRAVVGAAVDYVGAAEDRRQGLAIAVPVLVFLATGGGGLMLLVVAALGLFLYTRETARATVAASAYGTGLAVLAFVALQSAQTVLATGSLFAATGATGWLLVGGALVALGLWIRGQRF